MLWFIHDMGWQQNSISANCENKGFVCLLLITLILRRYTGFFFMALWSFPSVTLAPLLWRHNGHDGVSNHQPCDCLLNRLFWRRSKKTSKLRATGHCAGNSPVTGEFPAQMDNYAENFSIWWRHHALRLVIAVISRIYPSRIVISSYFRINLIIN